VTHYFEGSRLSEELRQFIKEGEFWRPAMVTSLKNLETLATATEGAFRDDQHSATASEFAALFQRD
jgi:hypothetical protein